MVRQAIVGKDAGHLAVHHLQGADKAVVALNKELFPRAQVVVPEGFGFRDRLVVAGYLVVVGEFIF